MSGFTVTGLSTYVQENTDELFRKLVLAGDTASKIRKMLGVKTKERLHYLDVDPVLQDGRGCGFNPQGKTEFSERELETAIFKYNDQFCKDEMLSKVYEYMVGIGAQDNAMPFEQVIIDEVIRKIDEKMEVMLWQGNKSDTGRTDLIDGFITRAENADSASTISAETASAANVYDMIIAGYKLLPEHILDKAVAFVSPANFRELKLWLVENFKYNADLMGNKVVDLVIPGTDLTVHRTIGLQGVNDKVYFADPQNMVLGADMLSDMEEAKAWYDDTDELTKIKIRWNTGVITIFPDEVVLVKKGA